MDPIELSDALWNGTATTAEADNHPVTAIDGLGEVTDGVAFVKNLANSAVSAVRGEPVYSVVVLMPDASTAFTVCAHHGQPQLSTSHFLCELPKGSRFFGQLLVFLWPRDADGDFRRVLGVRSYQRRHARIKRCILCCE